MEPSDSNGEPERAAPPGEPPVDPRDPEFSTLRELLIGPERGRLVQLEKQLEGPAIDASELGEVLPEAVVLGAGKDDRLAQALGPTIDGALQESVRRDPGSIVDAISPIMGPAIRRAIANALRSMVQSFNEALEHSFSLKGIRWRLLAWRTGRRFGEVALLHSLVYRVEQVFLIHRESGLLLRHEVSPEAPAQDPDLVSAMLTAIADFGRDSFALERGEELDEVRIGDLVIAVEVGPRAVLAAAVRGRPPAALQETLEEVLEGIHLRYGEELGAFDGDTEPFAPARLELTACLQEQRRPSSARSGLSSPWFVVPALLFVLLAGYWGVRHVLDRARWSEAIDRLRAEGGITVLRAERTWGGDYEIEYLHDPAARTAEEVLAAAGVDPGRLRADRYPIVSLEPEIVERAARAAFDPPETVHMRFEDGRFELSGAAPGPWLRAARARAAAGFRGFPVDLDPVVDRDLRQLREDAAAVRRVALYFEQGSARIAPGEAGRIASLGERLTALDRGAALLAAVVHVHLVGHPDRPGEGLELALARAREVRRGLAGVALERVVLSCREDPAAWPQPEGTPPGEPLGGPGVTVEVELHGFPVVDEEPAESR